MRLRPERWSSSWPLLILAAVLVLPCALRAQDEEEAKVFPFDSGPDSVDTSAYPQAQQDNYLVFAKKCSKCHTLARPINAPFALPEEWQAYVDKMQHKKRSGVDADSAKKIVDFLTYDSSVRKKDLIAQKEAQKKAGTFKVDVDSDPGLQPAKKTDDKAAPAKKDDAKPQTDK